MFLEAFCFFIIPVLVTFINSEFNLGKNFKASFFFLSSIKTFIFFKAFLYLLFLALLTAVCLEILLILFIAKYAKNKKYIIDHINLSRYTPAETMANTKSAIKRIRRISKQTAVNKARKSRYKNALKKMNALIENKKKPEALKFLPKLNSELMKVAKTGVVKKQNASRNVSRITRKIASL